MLKEGTKISDIFNAMSGLYTETPSQLHAVFSQFHSGEHRKADGFKRNKFKVGNTLAETFSFSKGELFICS